MKLGLTQVQMAREMGIPQERLASYEQGRATMKFQPAVKLAIRRNLSLDWLLEGGESATQTQDVLDATAISQIENGTLAEGCRRLAEIKTSGWQYEDRVGFSLFRFLRKLGNDELIVLEKFFDRLRDDNSKAGVLRDLSQKLVLDIIDERHHRSVEALRTKRQG